MTMILFEEKLHFLAGIGTLKLFTSEGGPGWIANLSFWNEDRGEYEAFEGVAVSGGLQAAVDEVMRLFSEAYPGVDVVV